MVGILGYIVSFTLLALILRTPSFHNAFGYLCISRLVSHMGIYTANIFWAAPALLLEFDASITSSYFGAQVGHISNIFWHASVYCHLQIAINRLIAVASPFLYAEAFSNRNLICFIGCFWVLSVVQCVVLYWETCEYVFSVSQYAWVYAETKCGLFVSFYLDFVFCVAVIAVVFLIDSVTFFLIRKRTKILGRNISANSRALAWLHIQSTFFMQGVLIAVNQAISIVSYHALLHENATKWERLTGTVLICQSSNIVDALILFFLNTASCSRTRRLLGVMGRNVSFRRSVNFFSTQ
ncbi:hypothetical protein Y032_0920g3044 [Ancylostoma ceylanicum]|nr:hypothetical protein Y032_0920g3044 [Ancylostoma ceylanicum]